MYLIEDLQVGRHFTFDDTNGTAFMSDTIQTWIEELIINSQLGFEPKNDLVSKHPLPQAVEAIFCQHEACVLGLPREGVEVKGTVSNEPIVLRRPFAAQVQI